MIAAAPITGWGAGESGRAYMNWFQEIDRTEAYATMVNSYLHVAVEYGLPSLGAALSVVIWSLFVVWQEARSEQTSSASKFLLIGMGASLVAWAVANVFTTLWIEPSLWIVPGGVVAFTIGVGCRRRTGIIRRGGCFLSGLCAMLLMGGLYCSGYWFNAKQHWRLAPGHAGAVVVTERNWDARGSKGVWHIWTDTSVLGATPGKEIRRWIDTQLGLLVTVVHRSVPLDEQEAPWSAEGVMLFGRQAGRLGEDALPECRQLWLIHPSGWPPAVEARQSIKGRPSVVVVLPAIDVTGDATRWGQWAERAHARVLASPGAAQDIRVWWPTVIHVFTSSKTGSNVVR
jgi:hypothetical protein